MAASMSILKLQHFTSLFYTLVTRSWINLLVTYKSLGHTLVIRHKAIAVYSTLS